MAASILGSIGYKKDESLPPLTTDVIEAPNASQLSSAAANYNATHQSGINLNDLTSVMELYSALETNSADTAHERNLEYMKIANDFSAEQAVLNRLFQQSSADKAMQFSADQAKLDREFQQSSADKAMQFSHDEAALNRSWQQEMSNTAYQRAVKDLKAAGINPILAYTQGGASVGSGSSASGVSASGARASGSAASGSSASGASASAIKSNIASVIGSVLSANAGVLSTLMSNTSKEGIADKDRAMQYTVSGMNSGVKLLDALIPG